MTGPKGNSKFCFPRHSMFLGAKPREPWRFRGNKTDYSLNHITKDYLVTRNK